MKGQEPGPGRTIANAGFAPSALAIADATLRGTRTTPPEVAAFSVANGHSGKPNGFGSETGPMVAQWAREKNLDLDVTKDLDKMKEGNAGRSSRVRPSWSDTRASVSSLRAPGDRSGAPLQPDRGG